MLLIPLNICKYICIYIYLFFFCTIAVSLYIVKISFENEIGIEGYFSSKSQFCFSVAVSCHAHWQTHVARERMQRRGTKQRVQDQNIVRYYRQEVNKYTSV